MARSNVLTRSKKTKVQTLLQEGRLSEAKNLCEKVVREDRLDLDAWVTLAIINRRLGLYQESQACARQALSVQPNAAAYTALGAALQCQGNLAAAIEYYHQAATIDPTFFEAHYLLGNALREHGQLEEAVASYRRACALQPNALAAISNLGTALMNQGQTEEALKYLNHALKLAPDSPQVLCSIGVLFQREGRYFEARTKFQQSLAIKPDLVDALAALAELSEKMGRLDEAKEYVVRGLALAPDNATIKVTAAKIARTDGEQPQEAISMIENMIAQESDPSHLYPLYMHLGKLYDRIDDVDHAFGSFTAGNQLIAEKILSKDYDRGAYRRKVDQISTYLTNTLAGAWNGCEDDFKDRSPAFLMGFPRSGTTLLDQILDSHPEIQTLSELPTIEAVQKTFLTLAGNRPDALTNLSVDDVVTLRKVYFDATANLVSLDFKQLLIDKMPLNTAIAHLIWRIFPHAKFILAIRHPCDVCLSCFMQNFTLNEAMTTFLTLKDTVALYTRVMGLWQKQVQLLPINYHRIRYEDLVVDFEGEARRLLEFLGVEWNDAVLNYAEHAKTRVITTPSYHQVTRPIYQSAKYRWKRYAKYLEPYLSELKPFIDYFGYAEA